jgi:hypothetical protein
MSKLSDTADLLILVGVGVLGYWAYQQLPKLPTKCDIDDAAWKLNDCVESGIESAWDSLTGQHPSCGGA